MKKIFSICLIIFVFLISILQSDAAMMSGGVTKNGINSSNQVLDAADNAPIENAKITIPKNNYKTYTDSEGRFDLDTQINGDTIMSVEKDGYRPFSVTIDENLAKHPIILGIQKSNATDIVIDSNMVHLGDDNYSTASANAGEFKIPACGPFYTKTFYMTASTKTANKYLIIGFKNPVNLSITEVLLATCIIPFQRQIVPSKLIESFIASLVLSKIEEFNFSKFPEKIA